MRKGIATFVPLVFSSAACAAGWTGCYVGAETGGISSRSESWTVRTPGAPHANESLGSHNAIGGYGGVRGGCDYEIANRAVLGIVGELAYHSKVTSLAAVAIRIGYSWDRFGD